MNESENVKVLIMIRIINIFFYLLPSILISPGYIYIYILSLFTSYYEVLFLIYAFRGRLVIIHFPLITPDQYSPSPSNLLTRHKLWGLSYPLAVTFVARRCISCYTARGSIMFEGYKYKEKKCLLGCKGNNILNGVISR